MNPSSFPEANTRFVAPPDLDKSQCFDIPAYTGMIEGGNMDGSSVVVVAWTPSIEDLARLNSGGRVYLSVVGGLPPHLLSTTFKEALLQNP